MTIIDGSFKVNYGLQSFISLRILMGRKKDGSGNEDTENVSAGSDLIALFLTQRSGKRYYYTRWSISGNGKWGVVKTTGDLM